MFAKPIRVGCVDVTSNEAVAAVGGRGLVHMMRIAVTGSMGQVATSLIEQAGREFEIVRLAAVSSCSRIAGLFSLGSRPRGRT